MIKKYSKLFVLFLCAFFVGITPSFAREMTLDELEEELKEISPRASYIYVIGEYAFSSTHTFTREDSMLAARSISVVDKDGKTKGNVGTAFAGKTVVYTLKQRSTLSEYSKIDDIKVEVKYDSSGYIKNCELLSSEDFTTIEETKTQGRTISLVVKNKRELGSYTIFVEKHAMDTDEDEGGYGRLLPGAKYKITVEEKNATTETKVTTWTDVTDENGLIRGIPCNGFGYITITLEELFAPDGYKVADPSIYKIYRDKNTGEVSTDDSNVNIGNPKDDWSEIYLMPVDQQAEGKYTLVINKKSATTGKYITASQAQFEAELIGKNDEEEIIFQDTIENRYTNKNGKTNSFPGVGLNFFIFS